MSIVLSEHVRSLTPSATLAVTERVAQLREQGVRVISLNVGEPDFGTPENICEAAMRAVRGQRTKYTTVSGILPLREAICEKLRQDNGVCYTPSQITVTTGAKQALFNAVMALCGTGDEVILPTPCWVSYIEMVKLAGGVPVLVPCDEHEGFALPIEGIRRAITQKTRAVLINTPNNPTGAVYTRSALEALGELAVQHGFFIISDEVYEKLVYDGAEHVCAASFSPEVKQQTVVINGLSKAYAMTGWRVGYAAADETIIRAMNAVQGHVTSNTCTVSQYAALEALTGPQDSVESMRAEFARRRLFLLEALRDIPGVSCANAQGAFYLLPNVSAFYGRRGVNNSSDLAAYLLEEAHVALVPGAAFEAPDNLRIAYANSMEQLREGAARIRAALEKL